MGDWDDDWQTVRRRRRQRAEVHTTGASRAQQYGAFGALESDPLPDSGVQEVAQKKKRKRKKGSAQAAQPQQEPTPSPSSAAPTACTATPQPSTTAAAPSTSTKPPKPTPAHKAAPRQSLFAWFWSLLHWLLPFLFKAPMPHPSPPTAKPQTPAAASPLTPPLSTSTPASPAKAAAKDLVAVPKAASPQPSSTAAAAAAGAAGSAAGPTTTKAPATASPKGKQQVPAQQAAGQAAAGAAAPTTGSRQTQGSSSTAAAAAPAAAATTKAAANVAQKPPKGTSYVLKHLPGSFNDVVGGISISGDLLACSSYDGNVQLFHLPASGAADPRLIRHLSGHTGRVGAVAAQASSGHVVTAGHDSLLKVWNVGADRASAKEAASQYLYEAISCMAADWTLGQAVLGGRSGAGLLWDLEASRRIQVLKGHTNEVSAVARGGQGSHVVFTGSLDGTVKVWDTRQAAAANFATLSGFRGRVCSLAPSGDLLYAGDQSSTVKVFDLRSTGSPGPARELRNAPRVAGEACPVAGLAVDGAGGLLLSSAAAWWSEDVQATIEAPDDVEWPVAAVNVFRVGAAAPAEQYSETVRLGAMAPLSCMSMAEDGRVAAGDVLGGVALLLPGNAAEALAGGEAAAGGGSRWSTLPVRGMPMGVVELDDSSSGDEESDASSSSDGEEDDV